MAASIRKGENVWLSKDLNQSRDLYIQIKWRMKNNVSIEADIDASIFLVNANEKVRKDQDFIFYNNGIDEDKSVVHISSEGNDNKSTGFIIHLKKISQEIQKLVCCLTIHGWEEHRQNLKDVLELLSISLVDRTPSNHSLAAYNMTGDIGNETALMLGEIYRHHTGWKFRAIGQGFSGGLKALAEHFGVPINMDDLAEDEVAPQEKATRRSRQAVIDEQKELIKKGLQTYLPYINSALEKNQNESSTRMILDRLLQDALGYKMDEIKNEESIKGKKADYVLSVQEEDVIVIEAKRINSKLRDRQIFQATSYGAHSGIKWAILTNVISWQLYRITTCDGKIESHLVFDVDIRNGLDDETVHCLYLISRYGIKRKGLLEQLWVKASSLTQESLINALLSEEVFSKVRIFLNKESDCKLTDQEVYAVLERWLLQSD
ncbi:TerD family protein [Nitrosococcus watsonii]|uniref:Stress protein n=1 Tax=Nitrosococcus watsoni (strain C-113) TaxID=105559 RepID=D8K9W0_NITWC|nr:TerD family protein [Nitrosococcus watsonii]ADJ29318.1 stress protein [Nitrosococcus watsonii C-113]